MIRRILSLLGLCVGLILLGSTLQANPAYAADPCPAGQARDASLGTCQKLPNSPAPNGGSTSGCSTEGVLISLDPSRISFSDYGLAASTACIEQLSFTNYLRIFLDENFYLIMFAAMAMIVVAGLQYMLSGFSSGEAGKAKQRIAGIIGGVVFYLLIRLVLNLIAPNIGLTSMGQPAEQVASISPINA